MAPADQLTRVVALGFTSLSATLATIFISNGALLALLPAVFHIAYVLATSGTADEPRGGGLP